MKRISFLTSVLLLAVVVPAFATNGTRLIGNGAVSPVMGGVGIVEPQDTSVILINPAGVTKLEERVDFATEMALIDLKLNTQGAASGTFRNTYGVHGSEGRIFFAPQFGYAGRYKDSKWYYGFGMGVTSGLKADFKRSRISSAVTKDEWDRRLEAATIEFVPAVAYKPTEKLSLGFSPVVTFNYLKGNLSTAAVTQTAGGDNYSYATGFGMNAGTIYDFSDKISAAFSFRSMRWTQRYDDYFDSIYRLDGAPEFIMGVAVKPTARWLIETNIKYIYWTWVDILAKSPGQGGFGWRDQWVFAFGTQYAITEKLKARMGYNYGKSPVRPNNLFANALSPLISEHHFGLGIGYQFNDKFAMDFGWVHTFENQMQDNGSGDVFSQLGNGTVASLGIDSLYLGFSYRFS